MMCDDDAIGDAEEESVSDGVAVSLASEDMSVDSSVKEEVGKK